MDSRQAIARAMMQREKLAREMEHQPSPRRPGILAGGDIPNRSTLLPFSANAEGETVLAWPQMALDAARLAKLPGQALRGEAEPTPADTMEMALGMVGGGTAFGGVPKGALGANSIRAYHGSPHDFDKFDMSKIGTGEGAQVYGHGLYFADKEGVAKQYRDNLSPGRAAENQRQTEMGRLRQMIKFEENDLASIDEGNPQGFLEIDAKSMRQSIARDKAKLAELEAMEIAPDGHMYEVNINADPEDFLDWDKPLSEQPGMMDKARRAVGLSDETVDYWRSQLHDDLAAEGPMSYTPERLDRVIDELVTYGGYGDEFGQNAFDELYEAAPSAGREFVETVLGRHVDSIDPSDTGAQLYSMAANHSARSLDEQVARLREAGIPGIKYLDQGSRGAGEGSSNYVVFDDSLIEILRKYGLLGPVVGGATLGGGIMSAGEDY